MTRRSFYLEIFLVSFAVLLLQISYTRIFSFKVSSYFTYLIIGFAMLGIGSGGALVALSSRLRSAAPARLLCALSILSSLTILIGYGAVARVELALHESAASVEQIARLSFTCAVLFAGFLAMGLMVAAIFARRPESIHRLYFADLAGAGCGCAAAIPAITWVTPPGCVMLSAFAVALAGLRAGVRAWPRGAALAGAVAACSALSATFADALPDPVVDPAKHMSRAQFERWRFSKLYHRWSPVFRIDVLDAPVLRESKALMHDGLWGSALWSFDGDASKLTRFETRHRKLPFVVARPNPEVLVIGAAGGYDVLAALYFDASHVTAVELNPVTVSLLEERFADFTGHLVRHERVTWVHAEGRSFLRRDASKYDLVYFVAPDSFATMNAAQASGFVLVESYLYTTEMIREAVRHLEPGGILAMEFGEVDYSRPMRTPRYLATARRAFEELGIQRFGRHVLLATTRGFPFQTSTILLSPMPFTEAQREAFAATASQLPKTVVRHVWGRSGDPGVSGRVIMDPSASLASLHERYPYNIRPVTDDSPFFWHFVRFRDVLRRNQGALDHFDPTVAAGESALLVMLVVSAVFAAAFLLLPFAAIRTRWARLPSKVPAAAYFAALGFGFMCFEIGLIQKLTLFLGYPTYTLTVTLFSLLLFSGVGSLLSGRYVERRDAALPTLVGTVVAATLFYQLGLDPLVDALGGAPLPARVALAMMVLAPLALALGAFMPLGLATVSRAAQELQRAEYVAWGWAVNGFFSVIGSLLVTILSMSYGFRMVLALGAALYLMAGALLRSIPLRPSPSQPGRRRASSGRPEICHDPDLRNRWATDLPHPTRPGAARRVPLRSTGRQLRD